MHTSTHTHFFTSYETEQWSIQLEQNLWGNQNWLNCKWGCHLGWLGLLGFHGQATIRHIDNCWDWLLTNVFLWEGAACFPKDVSNGDSPSHPEENGCGKVKVSGLAVKDGNGRLRRVPSSDLWILGWPLQAKYACVPGKAPDWRTKASHPRVVKPFRNPGPGLLDRLSIVYSWLIVNL